MKTIVSYITAKGPITSHLKLIIYNSELIFLRNIMNQWFYSVHKYLWNASPVCTSAYYVHGSNSVQRQTSAVRQCIYI